MPQLIQKFAIERQSRLGLGVRISALEDGTTELEIHRQDRAATRVAWGYMAWYADLADQWGCEWICFCEAGQMCPSRRLSVTAYRMLDQL